MTKNKKESQAHEVPWYEAREGFGRVVDLPDGWVLEAWWPPDGGRGAPTELHLRPARDAEPRGVTAAVLRSISLRELELPEEMLASAQRLSEAVRDAEQAGRVGRAGHDAAFYAELAIHYVYLVQQGSKAPVAAMAAELETSINTMKARIKETRRRGYLLDAEGGPGVSDDAIELIFGPEPGPAREGEAP